MKTENYYELRFFRFDPRQGNGAAPLETLEVFVGSLIPFWELNQEKSASLDVDIVRPKFETRKLDDALYPVKIVDADEVKGKVCVYDGEFVDAAIDATSKTQAMALIVTKSPLEKPMMPVFCLPDQLVGTILSWREGEAKLVVKVAGSDEAEASATHPCNETQAASPREKKAGPEPTISTTNDVNQANNHYATKEAYSPPKTTFGSVAPAANLTGGQVKSYSDAARTLPTNVAAATDVTKPPDSSSLALKRKASMMDDSNGQWQSYPRTEGRAVQADVLVDGDEDDFGATEGGAQVRCIKTEKTIIQSTISMVTKVIGLTHNTERFKSGQGWTQKDNFVSYRESMHELDGMDPSGGAVAAFVKAMPTFLETVGGNIFIKLAFACQLWTSASCQGTEELLDSILIIMSKFDFVTKKPDIDGLARHFHAKYEKPTVVFRNFFAKMVKETNLQSYQENSSMWANILWLWMKCGLLKTPMDWQSWARIRFNVGPDFWLQSKASLQKVLTLRRYHTLALFLQANTRDVHNAAAVLKESKANMSLQVEGAVAQLLEHLGNGIIAKNFNLAEEWSLLLQVLCWCSFGKKNESAMPHNIISFFLSKCTFATNGDFDKYSSIVAGVELLGGQEHKAIVYKFGWLLRKSVREDLKMTTREKRPSAAAVRQLLQYPWSTYLTDKDTLVAILNYVHHIFGRHGVAFGEKLLLFETLGKVVGEERLADGGSVAMLNGSLLLHTTFDILEGTCNALETCETLFIGTTNDFCQFVANVIASAVSAENVLDHVSSCCDTIFATRRCGDNVFAQSFAAALMQTLVEASNSMDMAARVFLGIIGDDGKEMLQKLACRVFCESFANWQPQSLFDADVGNTIAWQLVFQCFSHAEKWEAVDMIPCKALLCKIFDDWQTAFESGRISLAALDKGLEFSKLKAWPLVAQHFDVQLPKGDQIQPKIQEFEALIESIRSVLVVPHDWGRSLKELLIAYDCPAEEELISLANLLDKYSLFVEAHPAQHEPFKVREVGLYQKQLTDLHHDKMEAERFHRNYFDALGECAYFLKHPSVLFQEYFSKLSHGGCNGVQHLRRCVKQTNKAITDLLSSNTTFSDIKQACAVLESRDVEVEHELSMLAGSAVLGLDEVAFKRFRVASLVSRVSRPLRDFVGFCEQFKFSVVQHDKSFVAVKETLDKIHDQELTEGSQILCETLCTHIFLESKSFSVSDSALKKLEELFPILRMFGCLRRHHEIWKLAEEKQWFGKEGFGSFLKEFDHLNNVTMDKYDTTVLAVMEPICRVVSVVGGLKTEPKMNVLFKSLLSNRHVQHWLRGGRFHDFEQIQQSHLQIRRWFTKEENEISGYYRELKAIHKGGKYFISVKDNGSDCGLHLEYKNSESDEYECMNSKQLQVFIGQLSNIQHDDQILADSIDIVVEQYSIVSAAATITLKLHLAGFRDSGVEGFSCPVGEKHLDSARVLLEQSRQKLEQYEIWLKETRRCFPLTLLFWYDELRQLHEFLTEGNVTAVYMLMRLLPSQKSTEQGRQILQGAVSELLSSWEVTSESWLLEISKSIEKIHKTLGEPRKQGSDSIRSEVVVHSLNCDAMLKEEMRLGVLQSIYKNRLPMDFEILDSLSDERLVVFLERVKQFSSSFIFTILIPDGARKEYIGIIRSFLTSKATVEGNMRLHCLQHEPALPQASPFFDHRVWTNDSYAHMKPTEHLVWKDCLVGGRSSIDEVTVVASDSCCAGKTRHIRSYLEEHVANNTEIGTITVHEKSDANALIGAMASKFSGNGTKALHISILSIPAPESGTRVIWFEQLNVFFFQLLALGVLHNKRSNKSVYVGLGRWYLYVEFPSHEVSVGNCMDWLRTKIPILALTCKVESPSVLVQIDDATRRVCTYLRAYEDGSINNRFNPEARKQIVFVLDQSESMEYEVSQNKTQLSAATDYALMMFDSHVQVDDLVGVLLFNHRHKIVVPPQTTVRDETHKGQLRGLLDAARADIPLGGGTRMFSALNVVVESVERGPPVETWVVCLTDGDSDYADAAVEYRLRQQLQQSRNNLHIVVIGVNLFPDYEDKMRLLCQKYRDLTIRTTKGFYVGSDSTPESMASAFNCVAHNIPVSQTFTFFGEPSNDECRALIHKYAPKGKNMQELSFWIRFLYRRIQVMDKNESFNFNETKENLGSSLMKLMLSEVERLLGNDQQRDWLETNYSQLIYDFSNPDSPQFRLLCTSPRNMDENLKREYEDLELPGFVVPTDAMLAKRTTLDRLLSQSMGVPLEGDSDEERLRCIDDSGFILTLDFGIKILNIYERIACKVPCIMEGESGVSKTALSKMYSILVNSSLAAEANKKVVANLAAVEEEAIQMGFVMGHGADAKDRLVGALRDTQHVRDDQTELSVWVHKRIKTLCGERSAIFSNLPEHLDSAKPKSVINLVEWFATSELEPTFFELNIHSSLTEADVVARFEPIREIACKLSAVGATVVVFLDEVNTASMMGLFKEIVVDHSLQGVPLEQNIVAIAACNPARQNLLVENEDTRELDMGRCFVSGHYQVSKLPPSMSSMKWCFGALKENQEKDFILRRLQALGNIPLGLQLSLTEVISCSQVAMRQFAARDVEASIRRVGKYDENKISEEVLARSMSVVSLRDIQRVFSLFDFFLWHFPLPGLLAESSKERHAMLLAVAVVYLLRLDTKSRNEYILRLKNLRGQRHEMLHLDDVLDGALARVIENTNIKEGIARTRGLKETIFMTLVCTLSGTPLMIVGPPGCSKTLSVNAVGENALGEESLSTFFRQLPRLSYYAYQCSKQSSSTEVEAVFRKAIGRQKMVDRKTNICVVFLDEAGLPEEQRESLKVLHYLLESHMSVKGEVSFVSIANHVLDAAKSNRCAMLFREEPDDQEMVIMTEGVLYGCRKDGSLMVHNVEIEGNVMEAHELAVNLCRSYSGVRKIKLLDTFFGLRDYIYFLKSLRHQSSSTGLKMILTIGNVMTSIERNFNGVELKQWKLVALEILRNLVKQQESTIEDFLDKQARCPMRVLHDALLPGEVSLKLASRTRFKLIIDCSEDDSIMRILNSAGVLDLSRKTLFKLSHLPEELENEKLRLISGVKFAAMQGHTALLSQTESVDESFYDLQNQNFREIEDINGSVSLYANIAVGGVSRRCPVDPSFNCIVQVRESLLAQTPAPFLNRFEKYRLDITDVLSTGWGSLGIFGSVLQKSRQRAGQLVKILGSRGLCGWKENRTLDSVYAGLLPTWTFKDSLKTEHPRLIFSQEDDSFIVSISTFLRHVSTMSNVQDRVVRVVEEAIGSFQENESQLLQKTMSCSSDDEIEQIHAALFQLLEDGKNVLAEDSWPPLHILCQNIIQMVYTECVVSTLLEMALPEAVYAQSHVLPMVLVDRYFSTEHFSLKIFLERALDDDQSQLLIVHTRTDAGIHSIPSYNPSKLSVGSEHSDREAVRNLLCKDELSIIVEHMDSLRSESMVRKTLGNWVHGTQRMFLLLVDMSKTKATENVNYIRMCIEQIPLQGKIFVLLLHYPPSSSISLASYPALFLGRWRHTFLDGVGQTGPMLGLSESIRFACDGTHSTSTNDNRRPNSQMCSALSQIMPTVLSHLASRQQVLYKGQEVCCLSCEAGSFSARLNFLTDVMSTTIGGNTLGDILCKLFAGYWLEQCLESTVRTACMRLQNGTTQLSVSVAIHSTLLEAFDKFIAWSVMKMNTWRGFDLFQKRKTVPKEALALFDSLLQKTKIPPFEELMLLQERSALVRPVPLALAAPPPDFAPFPFFYDISSCIEELLHASAEKCAGAGCSTSRDILLASSMVALVDPAAGLARTSARRDTVRFVVGVVIDSEELFQCYVKQFVAWKVGSVANRYIEKWLADSVSEMGCRGNIVAVHCVTRCCHVDFMKVASWSAVARNHSRLGEIRDLSRWSLELLLNSLQDLEAAVTRHGVADTKSWCKIFSTVLRHCAVVSDFGDDVACRIRILLLFKALFEFPVQDPQITESAFNTFLGGQGTESKVPSLEAVLCLVQGSPDLERTILWHFFSPFAMTTMKKFYLEDFEFFLKALATDNLQAHSHQWKVSVLLRACTFAEDQGQMHSRLALGLAPEALVLLNAKLTQLCGAQPEFSESGERLVFPHFIPQWLQDADGVDAATADVGMAFFAKYNHAYNGTLATLAFHMVLERILRQSMDAPSADQLQMMLDAIHQEEQVDRLEYTRLGRQRRNQVEADGLLVGTPLATMVADCRVICFVAALARDLGSEEGSALQEPYDAICRPILDQIMTIPKVRFVDFFFSRVLHHHGEGQLMQMLGTDGPLQDLPWCVGIRSGMPTAVADKQLSLRNAEAALQEAIGDEERRAREQKLCPHCARPFEVLARNCGAFVCGRDAHDAIGAEGAYGCGANFQVDTAPNYRVDEGRLAPLRQEVNAQRTRMASARSGEMSWKKAREFIIPHCLFFVGNCPHGANILPSVSMLGRCDPDDAAVKAIRVVLAGAKLNESVVLLPDLIELYTWLHSVFGQIISEQEALERAMGDIMKEERLLRRFDSVHVRHMISLWERVVIGGDRLLKEMEYKALWNCLEVDIPFKSFEQATVFAMLSVGDDPVDGGGDFLFLIICEIITKYNRYVQQISELRQPRGSGCEEREDQIIHPKFLMAGSGGATAINRSTTMSFFELETLVEGCWNDSSQEFDLDALGQSLERVSILQQSPAGILNPLEYLREEFLFRTDHMPERGQQDDCARVFKSEKGVFFAREQDLQLAGSVYDALELVLRTTTVNPDRSIHQSFSTEFHKELDSHQKTVAFLGGLRNWFDLLSSSDSIIENGFEKLGETLGGIKRRSSHQQRLPQQHQHVASLKEIGLPKISSSNLDLLFALKKDQLIELLGYLEFHLASEGYLYSDLPVFMAEPLGKSTIQELTASLHDFITTRDPNHALACLKEFVGDVLVLYESLIVEAATKRNQSLKIYLDDNGFCGEEDPIFVLLPNEVVLTNYISLRQRLQQVELFLVSKSLTSTQALGGESFGKQQDNCVPSYFSLSAGRCWLWQPEGEAAVEPVPIRNASESGLWFLDCPTIHLESNEAEVKSFLDEGWDTEDGCARRIQKWWRSQRQAVHRQTINRESNMDIELEDIEDGDMDGILATAVGDVDEMDVDDEEFFDYDEVSLEAALGNPVEVAREEGGEEKERGSLSAPNALQVWLEENKMSQSVYETLNTLGASTIDDVKMVVVEEELLGEFKKLDQIKLRKAVSRIGN